MATSTRPSVFLALFLPLLFVSSSAHRSPSVTASKSSALSCDVKSACLGAPFPDACKKSTALLSIAAPASASASVSAAVELPAVIRGMLRLSISASKAASMQVSRSTGFGFGFGFGGFGVGLRASASAGSLSKRMQLAVSVLEAANADLNHLGEPRGVGFELRVAGLEARVSKAVAVSDGCLKLLQGVPSGFGPVKATGSVEHAVKLNSNLLFFVRRLRAVVKTGAVVN